MLKRVFDFIVSLILLIFLFPVIFLIALLVKINLGSPIIYSQIRPGFYCEPFKLMKFRTMKDAVDENGKILSDADRLTSFGRLLRSTSLDELPELWNVLKGDMSLVGPRPLLMEYLPLYNTEQIKRHDVRPGVTGWAQINGRNTIDWEKKFALDIWYVNNHSFLLDLKILFWTVKKVFLREGISQKGEATMSKFEGNKNDE